jgi:hypothetical protein
VVDLPTALKPAYGREVSVAIPGEKTAYPARYAVREASDVQPSHNAESFAPNPAYPYQNDRDYTQSGNAARVIKNSTPGLFSPEYTTTESPTAEHGAPVIDQGGNALGGNNRTMTLQRVYGRAGAEAEAYKSALVRRAAQFGLDPAELDRFKNPVLVRERVGTVDAQREITDFNKKASADLAPAEQAVSDGRRLSRAAMERITGSLEDVGEESTLAQALRGDDGANVINALVRDGVITEQEKNGYIDDRGQLTADAKTRIGQMIVGRLFGSPAEYTRTAPELRGKLERAAPHVLRVEGREGWALTEPVREALAYTEWLTAHGMKDVKVPDERADEVGKFAAPMIERGYLTADELKGMFETEGKRKGYLKKDGLAALKTIARRYQEQEGFLGQEEIGERPTFSPEAMAIARVLRESPLRAASAFRRYANDEALSRPGAQTSLYAPPTREEAFNDAFRPKGGSGAMAAPRIRREAGEMQPERILDDNAILRKLQDSYLPRSKRDAGADAVRMAERIRAAMAGGGARALSESNLSMQRNALRDHLNAEFPGLLDAPGDSLFGRAEEQRVAREAEADRARLEGERLTAQFQAPVTREEQLRRLRRGEKAPQTNLFEATPEKPQGDLFGSEKGGANLGAVTVGLDKLVSEDIAPTLRNAATGVAEFADDILTVLLPAARGVEAKNAALIMRERLAELARRGDRAQASLAVAKKFFDKRTAAANYEFINRVETGEAQALPELDAIAKVLRTLLDGRRAEVQALGKGKLQRFYENYFPHVWQRRTEAGKVFAAFFGRRPLEGGKSFLKERKYPTFADGLAAGLKPISDNPVDLVVMKTREMDRYIMAHQVLEEWKETGLAKFVDARHGHAAKGWKKVDDPIGTVYGQSVQQIPEYPNEGVYKALEATADNLKLRRKRGFKIGGPALGYAGQGGGVATRHGTGEEVLAHEIGHQIEFKYDLSDRLINYPGGIMAERIKALRQSVTGQGPASAQARQDLKALKLVIARRVKIKQELRDLADLRGGPTAYVRNRDEKMAAIVQAWTGAREAFRRTAPTVFEEWEKFLGEHAEFKPLRELEGSMNQTGIAQPFDVGGLVIKGHWWAPEGAARILNNYLSPGLRTRSGAFRAVLGLNNVLNQFQLGMSAFHLGFTSADAAVSRAALGFEALMRGRPVAAAKAFVTTPAAPFTNALQGNKLLKEWFKPGSQGGEIGKIVDGLVAAGGRVQMDEFYQTRIAEKMRAAFRAGNVWGGLLRAPFAGVEAVSDVIMKQVVPRQKLGVFADLARFEMERLGPNATHEQTREALAKVWDSVENRMGQMTYDNLFWNRMGKDLAMIGVRSVGWNLGTIREIGGGAIDLVKEPVKKAGGKPPHEINTHRIAYLMGLATVSAVMGAIYQYLATGKGPEEPKDYFFPRTGELDASGRPERVSLPTYVKDVYHYGTEPGRTITNKVAPIWSLFGEMLHNQDFYGNEIRNVDDPLVEQMLDAVKHVGKGFEPFGIRNLERNPAASTRSKVEQFVGITRAPAALERTGAERLATELMREQIPEGGRTHEQAARRDAEREIAQLARQGKEYADKARDYLKRGVLTERDLRDTFRDLGTPPLERTFNRLSLESALRVWEKASAEERRGLRPMLLRKAEALKDRPAVEQAILIPKLRKALGR